MLARLRVGERLTVVGICHDYYSCKCIYGVPNLARTRS
jgi:hypothetical protein